MTANQIAYWSNEETKRSNLAREFETNRSNVAREKETERHNKYQEGLETSKEVRSWANELALTPQGSGQFIGNVGKGIGSVFGGFGKFF